MERKQNGDTIKFIQAVGLGLFKRCFWMICFQRNLLSERSYVSMISSFGMQFPFEMLFEHIMLQ